MHQECFLSVRHVPRIGLPWGVLLSLSICIFPGRVRAEEDFEFFEKRIRPLLVERCEVCHSETTGRTSGGLALDSRDGLRRGGDSGSPLEIGRPEESLLIRAVGYDDVGLQMPPEESGGKLADSEIDVLVEWVRRGAPDPRVAERRIGGMTPEEARDWWSFQPLRVVSLPDVQETDWSRNEIDSFILAELEARGLSHAAPAEKRMLIRRATFDLTGLPPTPEEVDAFLADNSSDAFARVVERLLDSPAYGQRWGRHWLDVARYADYYQPDPSDHGSGSKFELLEAWRYRDWVVDWLNQDLPYDEFVRHQISGDLIPSPEGGDIYPDGLVATTFLTVGSWDHGDADKEKVVSDIVDDQIDTIGKAFLGLTLSCARCHDHKFDPITHADYYGLAGIFYSTRTLKELGAKGDHTVLNRVPLVPAAVVARREEQLQQLAGIKVALDELDKKSPPPACDDPERVQLMAEQETLERELIPEPARAMAVQEGGTPGGLFPGIQDVPIHLRGSYTQLGDVVPRRLPVFLVGDQPTPIISGSGRRELAAWVVSAENPLTARVIVNRVWQWHFGDGIVRTPSNFGKMGEPPTHPELLDWLAAKFMADDWSLKRLHRRIMLSATYQQSSRVPLEQVRRDPENRWWGRFQPRRLEAEAIRDAMLSATGHLDPAPGGPAGADLDASRRSLYVQTTRWDRSNFSTLFDAANPDASVESRTVSTVAPQALFLLNSDFVLAQADRLSKRLQRELPESRSDFETERIQRAYQLLFGRPANEDELRVARELIAEGKQVAPGAGWTDLAHVLLCSNEFVYLD